MNIERLLQIRESLRKQNHIWLGVSLILACANLGLILVVLKTEGHDRVVMVPTEICHKFWVGRNDVDPAYLEDMAVYFAERVLTYNPDSLAAQLNAVIPLMDPAYIHDLQKQLEDQVTRVHQQKISSSLFIQSVHVRGKHVDMHAILMLTVEKEVIQETPANVTIQFSDREGRIYIQSFQTDLQGDQTL